MIRQRRFVDLGVAVALAAAALVSVGTVRSVEAADAGSFVGLAPARLADTRPGMKTIDGTLAGGDTRAAGSVTIVPVTGRGGVPANAAAATLNVTITQPAGPGYATIYPCGQPTPNASNLNYDTGQTIANAAVVKVGDNGAVCVYVSQPTQLIVDVGGYFPGDGTTPTPPASTVPTNPIAFTPDTVFTRDSAKSTYWIDVPQSYDPSHQTPTKLFVWLHGCGGESSGDIFNVSPGGNQDWISIAVGGREDDCWDPNTDGPTVKAAIADVETHFNINRHQVILGGYSSGGDLAYRMIFFDANSFAGILAENTAPFRDTGSTKEQSLAAASWKFHVVHLAHLQDDTYDIATVRAETDAMKNAGFPLTRIEKDGTHFDNPGDVVNGHAVPGTDADVVNLLLPHIDDGWQSP
ncbi:MAG: CobN component of cobalt chelatase involved in biosynthesis [Ilumatobacteraceae bacterium]|nr:CobN component of cobalt chelatase involved in biosynthesis [Ilumatobacteraceae bacterium]